MAVNQFYEFSTDPLAFVESLAEYLADVERTSGQQSGIARAELNNRALRQGCAGAAALGQFVANQGYDFKDDGDTGARAQAIYDAIEQMIQPSITLAVNAAKVNVLQTVFPVGSFYFSATVNTNPRNLLGFGTWQRVEGRVLLGASSSYAAGSTGGAASVTLTVDNLPAHTHTGSATNGGEHTHTARINSAGDHTHRVTGSTGSGGTHTHKCVTDETGSHLHSITCEDAGDHSHSATTDSSGTHTHTVTGTAATAGNHHHGTYGEAGTGPWGNYQNGYFSGIDGRDGDNNYYNTSTDGAHSHTVTGTAANAGAHSHRLTTSRSGEHSHYLDMQSAGKHRHSFYSMSDGLHSHDFSVTSISGGSHTHTASIVNGGAHTHTLAINNTGGGRGFNIMPPYLSAYIWRRTA